MNIIRFLAIALCFLANPIAHAQDTSTNPANPANPPTAIAPIENPANNAADNKTAQTETVKIFLLRSDSLVGAANNATVWLDEVEVGSVAAGGFLSLEKAQAGKTKVRIRPGGVAAPRFSKTIEIDVELGESYYVLAEPAFFGRYEMRVLSKDKGLAQLEEAKINTQKKNERIERSGKEL